MKQYKIVIFLMIVASICTLLLSTANYAYEKASEIFSVRLYKTILDLFQIPAQEEQIRSVFYDNFEIKKIGNTLYYISKTVNTGTIVYKTEGPGLWSVIEILLAVDPSFETLYGLRILAQAETPGLGGRIAEVEFQERFRGVEIRPELRIVKFASAVNEVDAVSGASKTSEALEKIINSSIEDLDRVFGREGS
jgi:Na+-transporting NADH:ubiquinone oxidoreductase subunit C